jgi:hypothetical protein
MSSLTSWLMFGEHYACKASSCVPQFIGDPALRFWFHVFSPHRTRWPAYDQAERGKLIHDHASTVFEDYCRARHPGAARYWESSLEFDCVRVDQGAAVVTEVKFRISIGNGIRGWPPQPD